MQDAKAAPRPPRRRRATATLRWAARRLELRSFGLTPEQFDLLGGCRAAVATGVPLGVAVGSGHVELAWAVFAAFWTCLCDVAGPERMRRRLLAIFVAGGALIALVGSWVAAFAPAAAMVVGPLLVFLSILGAGRIAHGGTVGTLLAVVAVVAVGFPHPLAMAWEQAVVFLGGAVWALLLITVLWRSDPDLPLRRARDAVVIRLLDMAEGLVAFGEGPHRDERWHSEHAEHRRAVRLALERLRALLDRYAGEAGHARFMVARNAAEVLFNALIALDQAFIDQSGPGDERLALARAARTTLLVWRLATRGDAAVPAWGAARLQRLRAHLTEALFRGCTLAFEDALRRVSQADGAVNDAVAGLRRRRVWGTTLQQASRQSAGLVAVYYAAMAFHLSYPYWAAMAVVVVLQGGARVTWARGLERILGSLLGGGIAFALLHGVSAALPLALLATALAAAAIALRSVNYTLFVVFLTMLFVIVTEMLHPGAGIASARVLDNTIGSIAALLAVFVLWPDFGTSLGERIREGVVANRAYFEAVEAHRSLAEIEAARRLAGLASIEAEVARHDFGGVLRRRGLPDPGEPALQALRTVAGQAAVAWHRHLAAENGRG